MPGRSKPVVGQAFDVKWLRQRLASLLGPASAQWPALCVAWSGGADSTALLHALWQLRRQCLASGLTLPRWRALHIDHQLQPAARAFTSFCRQRARAWGVPLQVLRVSVSTAGGRSLEEAARTARYEALGQALQPGELLLLAQHGDDQLETVLLQCLRGAGVAGLAGMSERAPLGLGGLLRPLLPLSARSLRDYLAAVGLDCSEDPSNADLRFDRNYLRSTVLPVVLARWPAAATTVARSARLAAEAAAMTQKLAQRDVAAAADGHGVAVRVLRRLSVGRQRAALRAWVLQQGHQVPDERRLQQLLELLALRADAQPRVVWAGSLVQRHGDRLLLQGAAAAVPTRVRAPLCWFWQRQRSIHWPGAGRLSLRADPWGDVDLDRLPQSLWLLARQGGERLLVAGQHKDVKDLLREAQVPQWLRAQLPLVSSSATAGENGTLCLALADLALADHIKADVSSQRRARFIWQGD